MSGSVSVCVCVCAGVCVCVCVCVFVSACNQHFFTVGKTQGPVLKELRV